MTLTRFAGRTLNAWDVAFYGERLKRERLQLSEEALRPYFPLPRVLAGMFAVAEKLYGVRIRRARASTLPRGRAVLRHHRMRTARCAAASSSICMRARKSAAAPGWTNASAASAYGAASTQPVAYLVCNFMPPVGGKPALLTHSEVVTMFHEFGHGLHHMLTRVDYPSVAGINGVAWDAVELPSQFMENFAWRPEVLPLISGHVETGEPLPQQELERLLASRTFQAGMQTVRQLEFALFDLQIHAGPRRRMQRQIMRILEEVRAHVAVVRPPAFNRFAHSFQHIFSGGYAAGYYSYKWAEVLAADAFSAFEEEGVFNPRCRVASCPRSWSRAAAATRWRRSSSSAAESRKSSRS